MELWILTGAAADPAGQEGLASLTAESLRKGAGDRNATEFAEALDYLGADYGSSVNHDRTRISVECLAKDFEEGLALLTDAVLRPRFEDEEVDKLADQMAENAIQAKDNPRFVLGDYHQAQLFADHPYGSPVDGTEVSLPELDASTVKAFYADHYGADRAILAVVGDVDPQNVLPQLERAFAQMPQARKKPVEIPPVHPPAGKHVLLVDKVDTPQTWFQIGYLGPKWGDPDYATVELVRTIFGGRFTSRLNTKLRIESGLTYGARYTIVREVVAGFGYIGSFTATASTQEAIDLALAELDLLHEKGLSADELASAKAYVKGQTPYDYETGSSLANTLCTITGYGLGREFVDGFFAAVDATTLDDCRRVIAEWFPAENLMFTCIGVADEVRETLSGYGVLRERENSDPGYR
jgi:predicted Zn-dependent peptidase